jgi:hypothetical protein
MNTRTLGVCLGAALLLAACAGILGIRPAPEHAFEHHAHAVRGIACVQCHTRVMRADANAPIDLPDKARCIACHRQPHHAERACTECHGRAQTRNELAEAKVHLAFSHATHAGTTLGRCTRCHEGVERQDGVLRPSMATCMSCHEHREQWAARSCLPCHRNLEAEHSPPLSHLVHGDDFLARHGAAAAGARDLCSSCHAESMCAGCHGINVPALPSNWHFGDPRVADMHAAGFLARHSIEARVDPAMCTSCHRDERECLDCHRRSGLLPANAQHGNPHPAGWVSATGPSQHGIEARQNPVACASCHGGAGESLCVGCHRVGGPGGNPHPAGFHSNKRDSELPCRLCHMVAP